MARLRIIVLNQLNGAARTGFNVVLWADAPAARQAFYANADAKSAWKDATALDLTDIRSGSVVEKVIAYEPDGAKTQAVMRGELEAIWQIFQTEVTARNPWVRYGSTWDGTSWTAGGVS